MSPIGLRPRLDYQSQGVSRRGSLPGFFGFESYVKQVVRGPLTSLGGTPTWSFKHGDCCPEKDYLFRSHQIGRAK